LEIVRIASPSLEEFAAAGEVCETRWPYMKEFHTRARFEAFQKMGVELIAAREDHHLQGVCFVLPCRYPFQNDTVEWVSLFQLAARPETKNLGALLMMRIMSTYPAIVSMGVTDDATKLYVALKWKRYDQIWRGFHPLDMPKMAEDYAGRLTPWQQRGLSLGGHVYNLLSRPLEWGLGAGVACRHIAATNTAGSALEQKLGWIASYYPTHQVGAMPFVNAGGIGRILTSQPTEWGSLRQHARIWRQLSSEGAKFCEMLLTTPEARQRAERLGYKAITMPAWYQDKNGMVAKLLDALRRHELTFLHTDKSV